MEVYGWFSVKKLFCHSPENAGDWLALAGGAIFAGGMIRLEVVKTDGVFPIIFSFFFYGALFNVVAGFVLVDYLGEIPGFDAFVSMSTFLIAISVFILSQPE